MRRSRSITAPAAMPRMSRRHHSAKGMALDLTASAAVGIWERRSALAPALTAVGTAPLALTAYGLGHIDGALPYVIGGAAGLAATAAAVAYTQPTAPLRRIGLTTVGLLTATGTWAAIDPGAPHPWGLMALSAMGTQAAWLVGKALKATDKNAQTTERGERLISLSGWDGQVTKIQMDKKWVQWVIALGIGTRADSIRPNDVAHVLNVSPDQVHVWPGGTSRAVTIRVMHRRPSTKAITHPALVKATRDEWAPGVRSVVDMIPVGPNPTGMGDPIVMSPRPNDDVSHMMIVGASGSGKSISVSSLTVGLLACRDVIVAGADIPKAGQTFFPFAPAMACIRENLDGLATDIKALEKLSQHRIRKMRDRLEDKWDPRTHGPLIVYEIEEWAATVSMAQEDEDPVAQGVVEGVDRLAATVRSAGIVLLIITQRPDAKSMGSTKLRANIRSAVVHKFENNKDKMGILPGHDLDMSVITRAGDGYISCGGTLTRGRPWMVKPKERRKLAERYAERPGVTQAEADILTAAGWDVTVADEPPAATEAPAPEWAADVMGQLSGLTDPDQAAAAMAALTGDDVSDDDAVVDISTIPVDAPADVVLFGLVEALGDDEWILPDTATDALGWTDADTTDSARWTAKTTLSTAIGQATGGAVKPTLKRIGASDKDRDRVYLRTQIEAFIAAETDAQ